MIKELICKFCRWILSKFDNNQNIDSKPYNKIPVSKLKINKNNVIIQKNNIIEKVIYFINIGDKIIYPYMKLCISSYKENNKDFDFKFLNMTKDEFYSLDIVKNIAIENKIDIYKDFYKTLYFFKFKWLSMYGGIYCDLNTYCYRNLEDLLQYDSFVMCKSSNCNIIKDYCCMGIKKGLNIFNIDNVIYPPINFDDESYESMRLSFFNGKLEKNMFSNVINQKMHNYIYEFNK